MKANKSNPKSLTYADLVAAFPPRPIGDEVDLNNAEEIVERLAVLPRRTKDQEDYLEVLSTLIEKYETEHYADHWRKLEPLARLKYLMERNERIRSRPPAGRSHLGAKKILSGSRELSKAIIVKLARRFSVNPGMFIAA